MRQLNLSTLAVTALATASIVPAWSQPADSAQSEAA